MPQAGGFRTFARAGTALWLQQLPDEGPADGGAAQTTQPGGPRWVVTAGLRAQACRATATA